MSRRNGGCLLAVSCLLAAGCADRSHPNLARAPDWESEESAPSVYQIPARVPTPGDPVLQAPRASLPQPANAAPETWIPFYRWCSSNALPVPVRLSQTGGSAYTLVTTSAVCVLQPGSWVMHWNGIELRLGFAPYLIDDQPF